MFKIKVQKKVSAWYHFDKKEHMSGNQASHKWQEENMQKGIEKAKRGAGVIFSNNNNNNQKDGRL